jgi:hypothetical protein
VGGVPEAKKVNWVCIDCESAFNRSRTITRGSFGMEVVLWLFFCLPGLIYSVWRLCNRYHGCPGCGSSNIVPGHTPAAHRILESRMPPRIQ